MDIQLKARTLENALTYFERTKDPDIERMFPRSVLTREQAISNFQASLLPDADSFGQTIWADGEYVGVLLYRPQPAAQRHAQSVPLCQGAVGTGHWQPGGAALFADGDQAVSSAKHGRLCLFRQSALSAPSAKEWLCCAGAICGGRQGIGLSGAVNGRRERMYQKGSIG